MEFDVSVVMEMQMYYLHSTLILLIEEKPGWADRPAYTYSTSRLRIKLLPVIFRRCKIARFPTEEVTHFLMKSLPPKAEGRGIRVRMRRLYRVANIIVITK